MRETFLNQPIFSASGTQRAQGDSESPKGGFHEGELSLFQTQAGFREDVFQAVLDNMEDGVVILNRDGKVVTRNAAAETILEARLAGTQPQMWTDRQDVFLPDLVTPYPVRDFPLLRALRGESVENAEMFFRASQKNFGVWIRTTAKPLVNAQGERYGAMAIFRDISAEKRAEGARATLLSVTQVLAGPDNHADTFERILKVVCNGMRWDVGVLWELSTPELQLTCTHLSVNQADTQGGRGLKIVNSSALMGQEKDPLQLLSQLHPLPQQVLESKKVVCLSNLDCMPPLTISSDISSEIATLRSVIGIPIIIKDQVVGVMAFFSRFTFQSETLLEEAMNDIGCRCGLFIQRKKAEESRLEIARAQASQAEAEATSKRLQQLQDLTDIALASNTLKDMQDPLLARIAEVLHADVTLLLLATPDNESLVVEASTGMGATAPLRGLSLAAPCPWFQSLVHEKHHVLAENLAAHKLTGELVESLRNEGLSSCLGIPLLVSGRVIGAILACRRPLLQAESIHPVIVPFVWADSFSLRVMGDRAAHFIERLRLFEAERDARNEAEEYLALFDSLLMTAPIGFALLDCNLRYARVNEALQRSSGIPHSQFVGKQIGELNAGAKNLVPAVEHVLKSGQSILNQEITLEGMDGRPAQHCLMSLYQVKTQQNDVLGVGVVMVDVTARKQADEALRISEERFRLLISCVKDYAIIMLDPSGHIASWNEGAQRIQGYGSDEALGRHVSLFFAPDELQHHNPTRELERAFRIGNVESEGWHVRKDGTRYWANVALTALRDQTANLRGYSMVIRDNTERKLSEEELKKAKEEADAANKAKSEFLANMSHEIRTPLGAILGFAELILSPNQSSLERHNCVLTIRRNGELLSRIINEILDLSKIEAGRLEIEKLPCPIPDFMNNVTSLLRLQAQEKCLTLTVCSESLVPSRITTDPTRLHQILTNVIGNAIKFTERGGVQVTLKFLPSGTPGNRHATTPDAPLLAFMIADSGPGIASRQHERLFHPFTQADSSTTRKFGGTGLGLALSRRLARVLGGDLVLSQSTSGIGSTFTLTVECGSLTNVPFIKDFVGRALESEQVKTPRFEKDIRLEGVNVLLVEDAPDNQLLVSRFLKIAGAHVDCAQDGREGVTRALEGNSTYDVVLMDIQMPLLDGYQATRELREKGFQKPIIALTAHAMKEERERCLRAGCNDHLTKPINRHQLIESVAHFTGRDLYPSSSEES